LCDTHDHDEEKEEFEDIEENEDGSISLDRL